MNIQPIQMSPSDARRAWKEYTSQVRKHRRERLEKAGSDLARARLRKEAIEREDEALKRAYHAIAQGQSVINLPGAMRAAGLTDVSFMPRLAIARADAKYVELRSSSNTVTFLSRVDRAPFWTSTLHTRFTGNVFGPRLNWNWRWDNKIPDMQKYSALAPFIPPRFRPENLEDFYLLWEPKWERKPPDPDPFLVKPLGGGFFAIVAQWDMTPLEQSILEGRLT